LLSRGTFFWVTLKEASEIYVLIHAVLELFPGPIDPVAQGCQSGFFDDLPSMHSTVIVTNANFHSSPNENSWSASFSVANKTTYAANASHAEMLSTLFRDMSPKLQKRRGHSSDRAL
jgi:hypothetical protein